MWEVLQNLCLPIVCRSKWHYHISVTLRSYLLSDCPMAENCRGFGWFHSYILAVLCFPCLLCIGSLVLLLIACCVYSACKRSGCTHISNIHDLTLTHVTMGLMPHAHMFYTLTSHTLTLRWSCRNILYTCNSEIHFSAEHK